MPAGIDGSIDVLNYIFKATGINIKIKVHELTAIRSAKALIKAMGWSEENVVIAYSLKVSENDAKRYFPNNIIEPAVDNSEDVIISFRDAGGTKIDGNRIILQYHPFKFDLPDKVSAEIVETMKGQLNIGGRKIIVLGSPSNPELRELFKIYENLYNGLPIGERPLLIVGATHKIEPGLWDPLNRQGVKIREAAGAPFEDMNDANVLILNTSGELRSLYVIADMAIMGGDRNVLEPASQGAPVLYFDRYLRSKWIVNGEAKNTLVQSGAARRFNSKRLEKLLDNKEKASSMGSNGFNTVKTFKERLIPEAANNFASILLGNLLKTDKKLSSGNNLENAKEIYVKEYHMDIPETGEITKVGKVVIPIVVPFAIEDKGMLDKAKSFLSKRIGELENEFGITIQRLESKNIFYSNAERFIETAPITNPSQIGVFTESLLRPYIILTAMEMGIIAGDKELESAIARHLEEKFRGEGGLFSLPMTMPSLNLEELDDFFDFI